MIRLGFVALVVVSIGGAYLGLLFLAQRSLLFPIPDRMPDLTKTGAELVRLATDSGEAPALMLPARGVSAPAPLIIFTHGNGELAADWVPAFREVASWGVSVLLVEYPGYGGSPGAPTEASIKRVVQAAYDWAVADSRVDRGKIVAYGRSLGGGAAARWPRTARSQR